jgi:hypothetical protein
MLADDPCPFCCMVRGMDSEAGAVRAAEVKWVTVADNLAYKWSGFWNNERATRLRVSPQIFEVPRGIFGPKSVVSV